MMRAVSRDLRTLFRAGAVGAIADGPLLERFIAARDEDAFEALVVRHGPMVWGVCRRVLGRHHDAEDAFQASFLVLARKAATIRRRETVASWLYAVAYQTALKARAAAARRRMRERQVSEMPEPAAAPRDPWPDLEPLLDQELSRLPDAYRGAVILCDLEGKTRREAAQQLGWPEGTLSSRLARGRGMLARRLARHGLALSGGAIAAVLSEKVASAHVATALVDSTVRAAVPFAAGHAAAAGLITVEVASLAKGVLNTMLLTKLKVVMAVTLTLGLAASALATGGPPSPGGQAAAQAAPEDRAARATRGIFTKDGPAPCMIEQVDPAVPSLRVAVEGPAKLAVEGGEVTIEDAHLSLLVADNVRVISGGEEIRFDRLRPGLRVHLGFDHSHNGDAKAGRQGVGEVSRVEVLADAPRSDPREAKPRPPAVYPQPGPAPEARPEPALPDEAFDRFWKEALAKVHHTDIGQDALVANAKDCKTCHADLGRLKLKEAREQIGGGNLDVASRLATEAGSMSARWGLFEDSPSKVAAAIEKARSGAAAGPSGTTKPRREAGLFEDLTVRERDQVVTSVTVDRSVQAVRQALEAHGKLVRDRKAAIRALEEIEAAVRAMRRDLEQGNATP